MKTRTRRLQNAGGAQPHMISTMNILEQSFSRGGLSRPKLLELCGSYDFGSQACRFEPRRVQSKFQSRLKGNLKAEKSPVFAASGHTKVTLKSTRRFEN